MTTDQTKFQSEIRLIHRSEIKNAPYNPRTITEAAFRALKRNLKKRKLLSTLTWNKQTGNLVSGHRRLEALDILEKDKAGNYYISVSVADLSDKEEKEQNIFFNSTTVQGQFDLNQLAVLVKEIDTVEAGLDVVDIEIIGVSVDAKTIETDGQKRGKEAIKEVKQAAKKRIEDRFTDFAQNYIILSFSDVSEKQRFLKRFGYDVNSEIIKGEGLLTKIKDHG